MLYRYLVLVLALSYTAYVHSQPNCVAQCRLDALTFCETQFPLTTTAAPTVLSTPTPGGPGRMFDIEDEFGRDEDDHEDCDDHQKSCDSCHGGCDEEDDSCKMGCDHSCASPCAVRDCDRFNVDDEHFCENDEEMEWTECEERRLQCKVEKESDRLDREETRSFFSDNGTNPNDPGSDPRTVCFQTQIQRCLQTRGCGMPPPPTPSGGGGFNVQMCVSDIQTIVAAANSSCGTTSVCQTTDTFTETTACFCTGTGAATCFPGGSDISTDIPGATNSFATCQPSGCGAFGGTAASDLFTLFCQCLGAPTPAPSPPPAPSSPGPAGGR